MENLLKTYTVLMETKKWELTASVAPFETITAENLRPHLIGAETLPEFLERLYDRITNEGWGLGNPETGDDVDDGEFEREFKETKKALGH